MRRKCGLSYAESLISYFLSSAEKLFHLPLQLVERKWFDKITIDAAFRHFSRPGDMPVIAKIGMERVETAALSLAPTASPVVATNDVSPICSSCLCINSARSARSSTTKIFLKATTARPFFARG